MQTIEQHFIQALPTDNPYLDPAYIEVLKEAFSHRPQLLEAYLHGSWESISDPDQIIRDIWIRAAMERQVRTRRIKRVICCDTARFGDDTTVMMQLDNGEIIKKLILPHSPANQITGELAKMSNAAGRATIAVESTGNDLGAAVVDELRAAGWPVLEFCPAGKAQEDQIYFNLRAEAWSNAAKIFESSIIDKRGAIHFACHNMYTELRRELTQPHYTFRGAKTLVESKKDIKNRLGKSPDSADAFVVGLWALKKVAPVGKRKMREERDEENHYLMA